MGDSITNLPLSQNGTVQGYSAEDVPSAEDPRLRKRDAAAEGGDLADSFEVGGQPGLFPLTGGQPGSADAVGDQDDGGLGDMQDTGVQAGNGDMLQQLSQEYGPLGAMMMLLCSGGLGGVGGGSTPLDLGGGDAADSATDPDANPEIMQAQQGTGDARNQQGGADGVQYQQVSGSLWGGDGSGVTGATGSTNGISASVQQTGNVGDCYFLASLSAAAAQDPNSVKNMIRPDPNGDPHDYQVRFYAKDPQTSQMKEEWVSVNDQLPVDAQGQGGGAGLPKDASGKPILGPALIEKAFAKFNDEHQLTQSEGVQAGAGYNGIGNGGTGTEALEAITGKESSTVGDPNSTGSLDQQGVSDSELTAALQQANPPGHIPTTAGSVENAANGIVGGHEYTVLGTYQKDGKTLVSLRNPWGTNNPKQLNDPNQGVISISLEEFKKNFGTLISADGQGKGIDAQDVGTGGTPSTLATFNLRNQFMRA